ncbi:MAG: FAD-dependent oxidoreductase [bacterium]|jgi:glycerol-3-phosphate dehydrogenase|nr:FAD-dependent oxidoreductase [Planctomycetota bacterium]HIL52851.1 FAD-dependent oxidoreductase [Planctomycetota bacterium]
MQASAYDLVVIGGGIHGVGVAQAAAAAGHSTLLLEKTSLAAGTSSKSSKLIHGGLRYLESFELGLVRESLTERAILLRIAAELVHLVPFFVPIYATTSRRPWELRAGLSLYSLLGGLRATTRFETVPRSRWDALDGLSTDSLQRVFKYFDAQTDDALLTRAVMDSALELGAEIECPARFLGAKRTPQGYRGRFEGAGGVHDFEACALVNAAGPWVNLVREKIEPQPPGYDIELVQGAHIELEGTLERGVYYTEAPSDRRAVFSMPWRGHIMVGTTESPHAGAPEDCEPKAAEIEYLCETFAAHFPGQSTTVLNAWAGLRVLPAASGAAFGRTRETVHRLDDRANPHYLAIYGGKLTGYRANAEKVLSRLRACLPKRAAQARTADLPLIPPPMATAREPRAARD